MTDVTVRALGGDEWRTYRQLRLAALREAPDAFASSYQEEKDYDEAFWRLRMARSTRLVADREDSAASGAAADQDVLGIVSVGQASEPDVAELFGLWVMPEQRGAGVAWKLVQAAARRARDDGRRAIKLWVATDNGRAVAFFSSAGFRPADERRPMVGRPASAAHSADEHSADEHESFELAMLLPVGDDPGGAATSAF
jgi:ribosomal protein S18 acetylase RimI-like enzyme